MNGRGLTAALLRLTRRAKVAATAAYDELSLWFDGLDLDLRAASPENKECQDRYA